MNRDPNPLRDDGGWTLIELLVGLVLMSLITVLLAQAIGTGRTTLAVVARHDGDTNVDAVQRHVRATLAQARALRLTSDRVGIPLIEARQDRLAIVSDHVPAGQFGGLYRVAFELEPARRDGLFDLVEIRSLYRPVAAAPGPASTPSPIRSVLMRDVAAVRLGYFGGRDAGEQARWGADWTSTAALPALFAVAVDFPAGDRRRWPVLVVQPMVGR